MELSVIKIDGSEIDLFFFFFTLKESTTKSQNQQKSMGKEKTNLKLYLDDMSVH